MDYLKSLTLIVSMIILLGCTKSDEKYFIYKNNELIKTGDVQFTSKGFRYFLIDNNKYNCINNNLIVKDYGGTLSGYSCKITKTFNNMETEVN